MKFYMHAGSLNHGCEAIVRSTAGMTDESVTLYSEHPAEDLAVHLDEICEVALQGGKRSKKNPVFILCKAAEVLLKNSNPKHWYAYRNVVDGATPGDLFVSIGGDNYCYGANPYLIYLNKALNKRGAKTGLWGCSIEPDSLKDPELVEDMKRYTFISARETITYDALKNAGLINIHLFPDPAFTLKKEECALPECMKDGNAVGINLSPLVQKLDASGQLVLENYVSLIQYILQETDMPVVLIPHVCKPGNDDRASMKVLMERFPGEKRIVMVNEDGVMNCMRLKYIISHCRFMITARTHASIAAYSTGVPTLVVGYSVKARGIAKDLFGTSDHYVIDIKEMKAAGDLLNCFQYVSSNEEAIRDRLKSMMPDYIERARSARQLL